MSVPGSDEDITPTRSRALLERYVVALNDRRLDEIAAVVAEQVMHNGDRMSRERWWQDRVQANIDAVPDLRWNLQAVVVAGADICVRYVDTGTPVARFAGCEPTGASIAFAEQCFYRTRAGQIVETWGIVDESAIRVQLLRGGGS